MNVSSKPELVLAVDGGQSSTLALVAAYDGRVLGAGPAGPSNHLHEPGGLERLENALHHSIMAALDHAGQKPEQVSHICLGMTGGPQEARALVEKWFPWTAVQSHYDMVTALAGASSGQPGVIVIAGTGAVAYGRREDGADAKAGGWGYIMGDEGSGYDIGIQALRAVTQARDGRGLSTQLLKRVPEHFALADLEAVHYAIYSAHISRPQIAGLAAVVAEAARQGDAVAVDLLRTAGRELALAAAAVIAHLDRLDQGMRVYTTGGCFGAGPPLVEAFRAALLGRSPASEIHVAAFTPVVGALFMALQAANVSLSQPVLANITASLPQLAISKQNTRESP